MNLCVAIIRALVRGAVVYKNTVVKKKEIKVNKIITKSSLIKIVILGIAEEGFFLSF